MGFFTTILDFLTMELTVLLMATLPIIELRGAIPMGVSLGMSPLHAFIISFVGSVLPVPVIIFAIRPLFKILKQRRFFRGLVDNITTKTMRKSGRVQKYGFWGLILFVAIPLPGTGVWTGSLISVLLDMRVKLAFPAILIGNLIAGLLVMGLSHGAINTLNIFASLF